MGYKLLSDVFQDPLCWQLSIKYCSCVAAFCSYIRGSLRSTLLGPVVVLETFSCKPLSQGPAQRVLTYLCVFRDG